MTYIKISANCSGSVAVGMPLTGHPPHRSQRALLTHWAPASGNDAKAQLLTAWRIRLSALCMRIRPCVRGVFCLDRFPLASPLPSIASAALFMALFGDFSGTTGLSDFPLSFVIGLRPRTSQCGPLAPPPEGDCGISRFPCEVFPCVREVFDRAGSKCALR